MVDHQKALNVANRLDKIISSVENFCSGVAGVVLGVFTALISISVVTRYFLKEPLSWTIQFSDYALLVLVFFVASRLMKTGGHVSSEILLILLPKRILPIIEVIKYVINTVVSALLFWFSLIVTIDNYSRGIKIFDVVTLPKFLPLSVITIGLFLLFLRCVERTIHSVLQIHGSYQPHGSSHEKTLH